MALITNNALTKLNKNCSPKYSTPILEGWFQYVYLPSYKSRESCLYVAINFLALELFSMTKAATTKGFHSVDHADSAVFQGFLNVRCKFFTPPLNNASALHCVPSKSNYHYATWAHNTYSTLSIVVIWYKNGQNEQNNCVCYSWYWYFSNRSKER